MLRYLRINFSFISVGQKSLYCNKEREYMHRNQTTFKTCHE